MRAVIAEDQGPIRMDLRELLIEVGHEVVGEAANGEEALEVVASTSPDILFLDISMPKKDGLAVAEELQERFAQADGLAPFPIVMVTAFSDTALIERAAAAGVFGYVVKPFSKSDIVPAIEVARARFEQERALRAEADSLSAQLETRKVVDRAKGVLMAKHSMGEAEAFRALQRLAMDKRKPLKEIAEAVLIANEVADGPA